MNDLTESQNFMKFFIKKSTLLINYDAKSLKLSNFQESILLQNSRNALTKILLRQTLHSNLQKFVVDENEHKFSGGSVSLFFSDRLKVQPVKASFWSRDRIYDPRDFDLITTNWLGFLNTIKRDLVKYSS